MNIVLINHYAGSPEMGMEFRPYYLAREWVKMGHRVRIIAGDFSHLRIKNPKVKKDFQKENIDGIEYYWVRTGGYQGNGVKRALTMFRFVGKLWLSAGRIEKKWKPDVVITSSTYPLDTYAGQRIAKKAGARLIHEVHDMWPISPIELGGMSTRNPFIMLMQRAENSFCKHADIVVSLLPSAKNYFEQHGMKPEKFVHIANGIVEEEWEQKENKCPEPLKKLLQQLKNENKFVICFFGGHAKFYAISYLIQAIQELDNRQVCLLCVGKGPQKAELERMAQPNKDNIYFYPEIPKKAIPILLKNVDALYVGAMQNRVFRFGICMNKLFDSMMSGKPILYAVDAPNNYIKDFKCGVSVEPENVEALKAGITALCGMSEEERCKMGENGHEAVIRHFTYKELAKEFEKLF